MENNGLIYVGNGNFWPNVPARDLTAVEVKQYGGEKYLLETGLYQKPELPRKAAKE